MYAKNRWSARRAAVRRPDEEQRCGGRPGRGELHVSRPGMIRRAPPPHARPSGRPRAPAPARAARAPRGRNERNTPHHGLRQTRRSSLDSRKGIGHRRRVRRPVPPEAFLDRVLHRRLPPEERPKRFDSPPQRVPDTQSSALVSRRARQSGGGAQTIPLAFPTVNHATRSSRLARRAHPGRRTPRDRRVPPPRATPPPARQVSEPAPARPR